MDVEELRSWDQPFSVSLVLGKWLFPLGRIY